jgi:aflatoxin B1 aldehyde reductase
MSKANLVFGTMTIGEQIFDETASDFVQCCIDSQIDELDTAYVYNNGQCEEILGRALKKLGSPAIKVSTKVNPRISGKLDADAVYKQVNESLVRLDRQSVDTVYLHFPDANTPVESALEACDALYKQGKFTQLGLSNFPSWLVTEVYYKCREHGWVLPTVYEGLYNPLSRLAEVELFPAIRNLGMRFYAFNPLAGGLLTNKYSTFDQAPDTGRFTYRPNYQSRYWNESFFEAADILKDVCAQEGISIIEATYRWLAYHSALKGEQGDAIIIGASKLEQLQQNRAAVEKGPLNEKFLEAFEKAWAVSKVDAPPCFKFYSGNGKG